ncbi:hypothetical protein BN7_5141 [Wickerhamomyces ciferrii]|uniref:ATPase synthesis protein 25 n=1 Tax=Wickerhamomyces ciferrii (strain ATCC 14091 / BCRC 22168 / CBS 111 / JCM 3599 / NBRC 0793 / NRRL Y-1031 F-60-10) TaxID=1206466 RepID=K0KVP5_WICCF|nr:uncharacterized protein BN7_5141 [Wickerhamomyces ciferrii]CCH45559.1 hypothetical protein BN7_5141 [Wickerhamomyces ciferrii]
MFRRITCSALKANLVRSKAPNLSARLATRSFTSCHILRNEQNGEKSIIGDIIINQDKQLEDGCMERSLENGEKVIYDPNFATKIEDPEIIKEQEQISKEMGIDPESFKAVEAEEFETNEELLQIDEVNETVETAEAVEESEEIPWYMRGDEASELDKPIFKAEIPDIPQGAPESVEPLLKFCSDKLGLDDLKIFDIRNRDDLPISTYIDFMIITSGKSEKHIQTATDELTSYIKHNMDSIPYVEGLLKANSAQRQKRRIKKNVRKGGASDNEFGVGPNSWVMVDPQTDDFVIHVLTPERRTDVNLEYMWCKPEEKKLYEQKQEEFNRFEDVDNIFFGLQRREYSTKIEPDLSSKILQQFEIGDKEGLSKSLEKIVIENDASLELLKSINNTIGSLSIHQAVEELSEPSNKYIHLFESSFPNIPYFEHWTIRYQLYSTLNRILPDVYPIENLTNCLLDQSAAGDKITKEQYDQYFQDLLSTPQFGLELITTRELMNKIFKVKFDNLSKILRVLRIQNDIKVDNELIKNLLLLSSQYTTGPKDGPIVASKYFKIIIELYQDDIEFDQNVLFLSLNNLARAHDEWFWPFWNQLGSYETDLKSVSYDSRPWNILIKVISDSQNGKLIDDFIVQYTPIMINNKIELNDDMKHDILSIIQQHGGDIGAYQELVKYIQSQQ